MSDIRSMQSPSMAGSGVGAALRQAREQAGLSLEQVGKQLKMQVRALESLEAEQWERLGAWVFVRGQLRSYARFLKLDIEPYLPQVQAGFERPAELVSHTYTPHYQVVLESIGRRAVYVVLTAAIAIPVWLATRPHLGNEARRTASLEVVPVDAKVTPAASAASPGKVHGPSRRQASPITASLAPLPRSAPALSLRFSGDSWVQVSGPDGELVEQGLFEAGDQRSYRKGEVGDVVLGNAAAVEVQLAGSTVDTAPYQRANVARFTVSSEGSLEPAER
ncbi:hypothetical protein CSC70_08800 [Pseudoxanthomonas kalamensis DSM 18571]|uniref:helix-turn-helix domain-containing protein n=1 Tax=Pseudoxanthomonas kalamensis TaxID=289483 RepID=UPI0013912EDF|nr:RodZ domain-containing protein [Pseudoxanthomonas kalamensis]KAF1709787.1 hypothetical protein CSC70_08800 [Pseudoxanthomonas kalamensis DSM 18571]